MQDISTLRKKFPVLHQQVNGHPLVYLDNAATTQKPEEVIRVIEEYYRGYNANIHRGAHFLANKATERFEEVRESVRSFLNAQSVSEIIFTSGTTDSINLVAQTWGRANIKSGDEILVSMMEHHSNIVPWQMLAMEKGAVIKVIPINENGEWQTDAIPSLLNDRTKLVAVNHVSNSLGTINPIKELIELAHKQGARILIDGAQSVAHFPVDVADLGCDFYCFSAHKIYGPTGTGVLYGRKDLLEQMPPWRGGGEMIRSVSFSGTTYNDLPYKFEAGTPDIAGVIALGAAIRFVLDCGWEQIHEHENMLLDYTQMKLQSIADLRIYGTSEHKTGVVSFLVEGLHPYDIGTLLDKQGVAVRTGHHCTEPLWAHYNVPGTVRASFAMYNTTEEIDALYHALNKAINLLK